MARISALLASLALGLAAFIFSTPLAADEFSASQKSEIETIIKNYIMKNPEILRDAIDELENRAKAAEADARNKLVSDTQGPLYTSPYQAVIGNQNGKLTLIEFFDYNCGYCKKMLPDIARLMTDEPDLRIILRDYPILSDASVEAAQVAAAVRNQFKGEKFWEFHQKLLGSRGPVGKAQALAVAQALGADMDKIGKDMEAPSVKEGLDESDRLGRDLALNGTPSYVVGDEIVVGAVGYDALKAKLDNVRKCGKVVCS
jgi:protein-disulfide isomerase